MLVFSISAYAQEGKWPSKPVQIIVPYSAGGPTDIIARAVWDQLNKRYSSQSFLVENRGGAAGSIGTAFVKRAAPDGYTFLLGTTSTHSINPHLYKNLEYDSLADFRPVSTLIDYPLALLVAADSPFKSLDDIIMQAKTDPGSVSFGSSGYGASNHMLSEQIAKAADVEFRHIPYKGDSDALIDVAQGRVTFLLTTFPLAKPNVESGLVRIIALSADRRREDAPEIPAIAETVPGVSFLGWFGVLAPAKVPEEIVQTLASEIREIMRGDEIKPLLLGLDASPTTPELFKARIEDESAAWGKIVDELGIDLEKRN